MGVKPKKFWTAFGVLRVYEDGRSVIRYPFKPLPVFVKARKKYR